MAPCPASTLVSKHFAKGKGRWSRNVRAPRYKLCSLAARSWVRCPRHSFYSRVWCGTRWVEVGIDTIAWRWNNRRSLLATSARELWKRLLKVFYTWTLSFGLWDGWECTKNVKRHGLAMLVHAFILCSAHIFVMTNNYEMHALACQMISEASTVFLKPRAIMITLHGNEGACKRPRLVKLPFSSALLS